MDASLREDLRGRLEELRAAGLYKGEHVIETPQSAHVRVGNDHSLGPGKHVGR